MKTYKNWNGSGLDFTEFCKVDEEVDEDIVDYFTSVLPPARMAKGYLQVGEPMSTRWQEGRGYRETFMTFVSVADKWYYNGCCFLGESVDVNKIGGAE